MEFAADSPARPFGKAVKLPQFSKIGSECARAVVVVANSKERAIPLKFRWPETAREAGFIKGDWDGEVPRVAQRLAGDDPLAITRYPFAHSMRGYVLGLCGYALL